MLKYDVQRKPHAISYKDIEVSPGTPWVSLEIIKDFIKDVFKINYIQDTIFYEKMAGHWSCTRHEYINSHIYYG